MNTDWPTVGEVLNVGQGAIITRLLVMTIVRSLRVVSWASYTVQYNSNIFNQLLDSHSLTTELVGKETTMANKPGDQVAIIGLPIDVEIVEAQETKPKGSWISRFWGTIELDVKERKYVRKLDIYLL